MTMDVRHDHVRQLDEQLTVGVLPNGLEVFVLRKPGFSKKYAVFSTRYGSIDRTFRHPVDGAWHTVPDGIAHFLEHQLFEKEGGNVFDRFASLGASANAYTSYTMTSYLFSCSDHFEENLDLLLDFVQEPYFTEAGVAKEQGIIEQEIRMYEDHPGYRVRRNLLQALYHHHPVRIDILGTVESIRSIDADVLYRCHEAFYHPSNMALFAVGDVDPEGVLRLVEADMAGRGYKARPPVERDDPEEPRPVREPRVVDRMNVSRPRYLLGFKADGPEVEGRRLLARQVAVELLTSAVFGRSTDFFQRLYEEGLIDDGFGARPVINRRFAYTVVGGETQDPERLHEAVCARIEQVRAEGIDPDDVARLQRRDMGDFLRLFNSLEFIANGFLSYHFMGTSLLEYLEVLEGIDAAMVQEELVRHLDLERAAVSIVEPSRRRSV